MSSGAAAKIVKAKKNSGNVIYGETTAGNIGCSGNGCMDQDWMKAAAFVTRPPIRIDQADEVIIYYTNCIFLNII